MKVNFEKLVGKIKPMHAVNCAPTGGVDFTLLKYFKEAHIPYTRLHDMGLGMSCNVVDIPTVFPNFDADENDPASYDFEHTDRLFAALLENDCAPYYRLGVSIENAMRRGCKPRHILPPKDFGKWARICEHIIRHYNEGWAEGFCYGIKYWEIWNEPENGIFDGEVRENNQCWWGTDEEFYELYTTAAKHLKTCFGDSVKVGGYAACTNYALFEDAEKWGLPSASELRSSKAIHKHRLEFMHGFLGYIRAHNAPLDFYSWHTYWDFDHNYLMAIENQKILASYGYGDTETHLNEWNNAHEWRDRGTAYASAMAAAMMLQMQDTPLQMLMYYDAKLHASPYGGMFNPINCRPFCLYYSFKAFGEMYLLGRQAECIVEEEKLYAVAATDGVKKAVMISNIGEEQTLTTNLEGFEVYLVDESHNLERVDWDSSEFTLKPYQVVYLSK